MGTKQAETIELTKTYPCPRRCRGQLVPITLTEAMGCNCCQQIFVVTQSGAALERVVQYPYPQAWKWDGRRWFLVQQGWRNWFLPLALAAIGVMLILLVLGKSVLPSMVLPIVMLALVVAIVPGVLMVLSHRSSSPLE